MIRMRFVLKGLLFSLMSLTLVSFVLWLAVRPRLSGPSFGSAPPEVQLAIPAGILPEKPAGLLAQSATAGSEYHSVGSGFHLEIGAQVVGVMAAHSLGLGITPAVLEKVEFVDPGSGVPISESLAFWGAPGRSRLWGLDLRIDYALLALESRPDEAWILAPDLRGGPQPGERVVLHSGKLLNDQAGLTASGIVYSSDARSAWVLMEGVSSPSGISGSPLLSQHTGKVVGMALVAVWREQGLFIGMHPIGSLMELGQEAKVRLPMIDGDY